MADPITVTSQDHAAVLGSISHLDIAATSNERADQEASAATGNERANQVASAATGNERANQETSAATGNERADQEASAATGNERADQEASAAITNGVVTIGAIPLRDYYLIIKSAATCKWNSEWQAEINNKLR